VTSWTGVSRRAVAAVLATGLVLAACGGDDDDDAADVTTAGTGTQAAATAAPDSASTTMVESTSETTTGDAAPATTAGGASPATTVATTEAPATTVASEPSDPEGVIRVGYDLVLQGAGGFDLDPGAAPTGTNDALYYLIYGRLLRPTADGGLEPDLAESATVLDSGTIEVVIREGVTFHDGSPFDAAAVKAALDRTVASNNEPGLTPGFFALQSVEVTAPDTVVLSIADGGAAGWYDGFLGSWQTSIALEGTDFGQPVGAGPFSVVSYEPQQSLVLDKYDGYWDADAIRVGGYELTHVGSDQVQSGIAGVKAGQLDIALADATQLAALTGNVAAYTMTDATQTVEMMVCKADGPLADPAVRTAINKAIDRETIAEVVYQDTATPMTQLWPDGHRLADPDLADDLAYDPDAARQLLADAGHADDVTFDVYVIPALGLPDVAQIVQQQLAEVGVTMNIVTAGNFVEDFLVPQAPGAGLIPGNSAGLEKLNKWVGEALSNACAYDDPALTAIAEQLAGVSISSDEAADLWHQAGDIVVGDALGIFIAFRSVVAAYDVDRLGGLDLWPTIGLPVPDPRSTFVKAGS
jgi:peptide/nickel transport system substrate-binding protein